MLAAVFLDRDGVINQERADYVKSWEEFQLLPGVLSALRQLASLQVPICVLTNQSAIGRGHVAAATVDEIHCRLARLVEEEGGHIDAFFVCPHHPNDDCSCRKPKPGLLHQAAHHFGVELPRCVFVGDALSDFLAADAAQCQAIMVTSGRQGSELAALLQQREDVPVVSNLSEAVAEIVRRNAIGDVDS
jgi:D-glycero-D-manno-heptose 1,7-bisphosphate phosphatase